MAEQVIEPLNTEKPSKRQIYDYIKSKNGDYNIAFAIMMAESGGIHDVRGRMNGNGTYDHGLFQINDIHGQSMEAMYDGKKNIDFAHKLYKIQGGGAGVAYKNGTYKRFM